MLLRAVVIHQNKSLMPEDEVVNIWHFGTGPQGSTLLDRQAIRDALQSFYHDQVVGVGGPIDTFFSAAVSRPAGRTIKMYEKDVGVKPFGSPKQVFSGLAVSDVGSGAANYPSEVACVLSYRGDLTDIPQEQGNTRPAARRRGHIYLGPWNSSAADGVLVEPRPGATLRSLVAGAARRLITASDAAPTWTWVAAHASDESTWSVEPVVAAYVDDAWDTQRRRGLAATSRTAA